MAEDPARSVIDQAEQSSLAKQPSRSAVPNVALVRPAGSSVHKELTEAWNAHDAKTVGAAGDLLAAIDSLRVEAREAGDLQEALRLRSMGEALSMKGELPADHRFSSQRRKIFAACEEAGKELITAYRQLALKLTKDLSVDEKLAKQIDDERSLLESKLDLILSAGKADASDVGDPPGQRVEPGDKGRNAGLTRPKESFSHPTLTAAWTEYRSSVDSAMVELDRRLAELHMRARKEGNLQEALAITEIRDEVAKAGVLAVTADGRNALTDFESTRTKLTSAEQALLQAYGQLIDSLTKDASVPEEQILQICKERDSLSQQSKELIRRKTVAMTNSVGMTFLRIPAADGKADPRSKGEQAVAELWFGQHEVTNAQWKAVMGGEVPSQWKADEQPVNRVSWHRAVEFCMRLEAMPEEQKASRRYRLPTAAEWEYAARAGNAARWPCGDEDAGLIDFAWFKSNSGGQPHPVGTSRPNSWGLQDMLGNVYEWCEDNRDRGKTLIGGAYDTPSEYTAYGHRTWGVANNTKPFIGFRLVLVAGAVGGQAAPTGQQAHQASSSGTGQEPGVGRAIAGGQASNPQNSARDESPKSSEKPLRLADGRQVTTEEVKKHNERIVARNLRAMAVPPDPVKMLTLERNMKLFNSFFLEGVIPAYCGIWPIGRVDAVFRNAVNRVRQRPDAQQAITWVLEELGIGEMWLIYGREVKTYDEIWDECLLRFVELEKGNHTADQQAGDQVGDTELARNLTDLTPEIAEHLARRKGDLLLDRLAALSDEAASALARHKGYLRLESLSELSAEAAEALSKHEGGLSLGGLTTLSDEAAESLARHEGTLSLNGLTALSNDAAAALSRHKGPVSLSSLSVISKEALALLRGNPDISLPFELRR